MALNLGSAMQGFYRGYGFVNNLQQQKIQNERRDELLAMQRESLDARLRGMEFDRSMRGKRFEYDQTRAEARDKQWQQTFNQRATENQNTQSNREKRLGLEERGLGLREAADTRAQRTSDRAHRQAQEAEQTRKRAEAARALQNIFTAEDGSPLGDEAITQAHLDQALPIFNQMDGLVAFGGANPDVDPENPFARATLIPATEEGGKPTVAIGLRMKDGGVEPMTEGRGSDPEEKVINETLANLRRVVIAELDPAGVAARRKAYQASAATRAEETFKTDQKIRAEEAKGIGGANATTNSKKYNEMLALGVPDQVARGVAYGTIKLVTDDRGTALVDLASGHTVGSMQRSPGVRGYSFQMNPEWAANTQAGAGIQGTPAPTGQTTDWNDPKYAQMRWTFTGDDGKETSITMADIKHTATKRNMSVDAVLEKLGISLSTQGGS